MSSDLKADLLRDALSPSPNGDPEWLLQLRARLERATVTEPDAKPAPPTITFAQWCERQGISYGDVGVDGTVGWWAKMLGYPTGGITICDLARAVLALPDQYCAKAPPGCRHFWDSWHVWENGSRGGLISRGLPGTADTTHSEARAVLAHFGEAEKQQIGYLKEPLPAAFKIKFTAAPDPFKVKLDALAERVAALELVNEIADQAIAAANLDAPPPTDAELLDALRRELGEGWVLEEMKHPVAPSSYDACCVRFGLVGVVKLPALRKPNGPRDCAAALKVLAGEGE